MEYVQSIPVWLMAAIIFSLRIVDVSMGTVRTIAIVDGRVKLSVVLGFFEVLVWIIAVSQVITRVKDSPVLVLAYAAGFATGNAIGILIERRLALGTSVVRLISAERGTEIAESLRREGQILTTFEGQGREGTVTLIYVTCPRKAVNDILHGARRIDPHLFYEVGRANQSSLKVHEPSANSLLGLLAKKK